MRYEGDRVEGGIRDCCDEQYIELLHYCVKNGEEISTRNSKVKRLITSQMWLYDTPLVSVRKTAWKNALREWEWFMSGSDRIEDLHPSVRHWWAPWANGEGRVKYNYSQQLREFVGSDRQYGDAHDDMLLVDQVALLVEGLKKHPNSRRNLLTTWNAAEMVRPDCPITNCHNTVTQAFVTGGNRLHLVTYQRSVDVVCGLPHNLIQMAAFQMWLCARTGLVVDGLTWIGGDVHVYEQHYELADKMLKADLSYEPGPVLCYQPTSDDFKADDFYLDGEYKPVLTDKAEMVV